MKGIEKFCEHIRSLPIEKQAEIINATVEPPCNFCIHFDGKNYECDDFEELNCIDGIKKWLEKNNG